jgi:hypothetical protein
MRQKIAIVVIATNAYFTLGVRLINRFHHFNKADDIEFHFFADVDPAEYLPDDVSYQYYPASHSDWVAGVNSKFLNILSLQDSQSDYLYYIDADTGIHEHFNMEPFFGSLMGSVHFMDQVFESAADFPFDRYPESACFVPLDSPLPNIYYHGAIFGGRREKVMNFCREILLLQEKNQKIIHEPVWNDESHLNYYFHYNPPDNIFPFANFPFVISCKGGIENTRNPDLDLEHQKEGIRKNRNRLIDIRDGNAVFD